MMERFLPEKRRDCNAPGPVSRAWLDEQDQSWGTIDKQNSACSVSAGTATIHVIFMIASVAPAAVAHYICCARRTPLRLRGRRR
jgi:hypothetical protein